ncbi:MAG: class D sortase [Clostridiaceae bacterium]
MTILKKRSQSKNSEVKRKNGITLVIPLFLLVCGLMLFLTSAWNMIIESSSIGTLLFSKPPVEMDRAKISILDKQVYSPRFGEKIGRLIIASLNIDKPILFGDSLEELAGGVSTYPSGSLPGQVGNTVLAGHRDTVFRALGEIKVDELIKIETYYGEFTYKVSNIRITSPQDASVLARNDKSILTIYTCYPFNYIGNAPNRYVVVSEFVEGKVIEN